MPPAVPTADADPVPPDCRAAADLIQLVLDGALAPAVLDADPHPATCPACRERARLACAVVAALARPAEPVAVPPGFTDAVVAALAGELRAERRRAAVRRVGGRVAVLAALAAGVLFVVFQLGSQIEPKGRGTFEYVGPIAARPAGPVVAPAPREKVPAAPPARLADEVAKAGQSLRDVPKPIADSVAVAPKLFDAFALAFRPVGPPAPMGDMLEPARRSLAELPDAARTGLQPVTGTAQKAFDRLLRDVAVLAPKG